MRKLAISTVVLACVTLTAGCVMVIGTGERVRRAPVHDRLVEIEGVTYVVDVEAGTVHPLDDDTSVHGATIGVEISDD